MNTTAPGREAIPLRWAPREPPLTPVAVTVETRYGAALVAAVRRRVSTGGSVRVLAGAGRLIVLAETEELPWCTGARYLGWDGGLLLPTEIAPSPGAEVLRAAVAAEPSTHPPLLAVLPDALVFAVLPSRPVDLGTLSGMFEETGR